MNNVRKAESRAPLTSHHMAIVDLADGGGWDWTRGEPPAATPAYYLRFCKTFHRMGGTLDYIRCDNRVFFAQLLRCLRIELDRNRKSPQCIDQPRSGESE